MVTWTIDIRSTLLKNENWHVTLFLERLKEIIYTHFYIRKQNYDMILDENMYQI